MQSVALCSLKGGVGKTTVALNLALSLARRGSRTILIDADPSSDVPNCLDHFQSVHPGLGEVLAGDCLIDNAVRQTREPQLSVLAGGSAQESRVDHLPLLDLRSALSSRGRWANALDVLGERFDVAVIDTAAENTEANRRLFSEVDYALIPLQAEPLGFRSITRTLDFLGQVADAGRSPELLGFLLTMVNARNSVSLDVAGEAWRRLPESLLFESTILRHDCFLKASAEGVPLALLSRKPPAMVAVFDQLAAELECRLGLTQESDSDGPIRLMA